MLGLVILTSPRGREMVQRVRVRTITNDRGTKLLRMVRRSSGSVVTWRRAQMVLLSAQDMEPTAIAEVTFTSDDRVRDEIHNFNSDGFACLAPKYGGGRPPKFTLPQRQAIKKIALAGRSIMICRSRPGACRSWRTIWSPRGWSTTSATRAYACCSVRRESAFKP